jgi:hypothetical protein
MGYLIEEQYKGHKYIVDYDECRMNPRDEFENLGTIYANRRDFNFDNAIIPDLVEQGLLTNESHPKATRKFKRDYICRLVYYYEHGGVALSLRSFGCPFDSGVFGWIAVPKSKVRQEYGCKRVTRKIEERVVEVLKCEIEELQAYINGDVYVWCVDNEDACGGYLDPHEAEDEAKALIDTLVNNN